VSPRLRDGLSVLLLCDDSPKHAPNVLEHIGALQQFSRHRVELFNPIRIGRTRLLRLDDYDVVIVHYSIFVLEEAHLSSWFREQLTKFSGLKVQFIQDEYRRVDEMTARIRELGIHLLFSSVPPQAVADVYGSRLPGVEILPTLTGYVPATLEGKVRQPLAGRPLDVVYRGRSIPYWLGRLGQDKVVIGREFLTRASSTDLRCDVAWTEAERIYGDAWYRFLSGARTTLGTESGASIVDFDGSLQKQTDAYLRTHPSATFEEVEAEILAPFEGNAVIETISPRVFEAAALGTAMVNFAGGYSEVIEPWVHYVSLEKDFSNFDDVVALIRNDAELEQLATRAHTDLVASGRFSLRTFVDEFDREIDARALPARRPPRPWVSDVLHRKLISLEQLQSPARVAQLPLVDAARTRAGARFGRRLLHRFPELEVVAKRADRAGPPDRADRVQRDLLRLAAATAAHLRELRYLGRPFDVQVELEDECGKLMLVSGQRPPQDPAELNRLYGQLALAIENGSLQEIVWDNSAVGGSFSFFTFPISSLDVGYHVVGGAHRFTGLEELAREDVDGTLAAFAPLFRSRPDAPVHELDQRVAVMLRVLLAPRTTAALWTATAGSGLEITHLRRLLFAYLGSGAARAESRLHVLLKDFFRLRLIAESPTDLELHSGSKTLVFRSNGSPSSAAVPLDAATIRSIEQIVWDHSAVGSSAALRENPRVSVTLDGGVYEFEALPPVARRFPELVLPALQWAARSG
jgi:hypothetical protein